MLSFNKISGERARHS